MTNKTQIQERIENLVTNGLDYPDNTPTSVNTNFNGIDFVITGNLINKYLKRRNMGSKRLKAYLGYVDLRTNNSPKLEEEIKKYIVNEFKYVLEEVSFFIKSDIKNKLYDVFEVLDLKIVPQNIKLNFSEALNFFGSIQSLKDGLYYKFSENYSIIATLKPSTESDKRIYYETKILPKSNNYLGSSLSKIAEDYINLGLKEQTALYSSRTGPQENQNEKNIYIEPKS